jgi:hypothetical protein
MVINGEFRIFRQMHDEGSGSFHGRCHDAGLFRAVE